MSYQGFSEDIEEGDFKLSGTIIKIENSILAFFDEKGSFKLGTLAIAMPQLEGKTCISSILLGDRNQAVTKILAERFARAFNELVLVSTHLAEIKDAPSNLVLMKLAQKLIEKAKE
jgi:hypothetical protein